MKIGIIGIGYWGPNLVRNFLIQPEVEKVIAVDTNEDRLDFIKGKFPAVFVSKSYEDLLYSDVDAVAIATPVYSHYPLAKKALLAGKHVWIEKPFTYKSSHAEELIALAEERNLKLFVDHTFLYTGAVRKIKEIIDSDELGDIIYFDSVRINLGLFQHDINVIWDLAPHDLSIMNYLISDKSVAGVTATGISNYYDLENLAQLSLYFNDDSCFAHFHVNWTSPVKIRRMIIAGKKKMLVFDDMENSEKIKIYDCGVDITSTESLHNALVQYRVGDMYSPKVEQTEALYLAAKEFLGSIKNSKKLLTDGVNGLEVVKLLEASDQSLKQKGKFIPITPYVPRNGKDDKLNNDVLIISK